MKTTLSLSLPDWVNDHVAKYPSKFQTVQERMSFVLAMTRQNIQRNTGGPFGSAIFNMDTGELVSCGVNRSLTQQCSSAHAQMMAIMLGHKTLNIYDFSLKGRYQLVTSSKMCIMCLGAVIWSRVSEVVYSADTQDTQKITGWDEGPLPSNVNEELIKRGINVVPRVLNEEGCNVLKLFINKFKTGEEYQISQYKKMQNKQ